MKLEHSFTVAAPAEQVWAALVDVERVAPCLPGAQITQRGEGGSFQGQFTVKLGPTTAAYNGTLKMEELDEAARTAVMSARGTDRRGQGGAAATIRSTVTADGDGTRVDIVTDFTITGRLASFGRGGMIQDVSRRLLAEFASCLQSTLDAGAGGAEVAAPQTPTAPAPPASAEAAPAGAPDEGQAAAAAATAEAAAGQPIAPPSAAAESPDLPGEAAAAVTHFDPGSGGAPPPAPGPVPVPGPPGAGDAGAVAPPPLPPIAPPPNPPAGGPPPGPVPPPHVAPTEGTAEGAPTALPGRPPRRSQPPRPQPQVKPLNALDLILGVLKDRLAALVRRFAAWLRRVGRASS